MGTGSRWRGRLGAIVLVIMMAGGATSCGWDLPGTTSGRAPDPSSTVPAATSEIPSTSPPTSTTTVTATAPPAAPVRITQMPAYLCAPTTPIDLPDGSFTPRTWPPGAPLAGVPAIGTQQFQAVEGDDDLIRFGIPAVDPNASTREDTTSVLTVGHLDRATGAFEPLLTLERCAATAVRTDGTYVWVVARTGDASTLVEIDLRTGTSTWTATIRNLQWWSADGDALLLALGGASDDGTSQRYPPFGIDTIEKGTGRSLASVDIQPEYAIAMPSDSALWIRSPERGNEAGPFREIDPTTGAEQRSVTPSTTEVPVIQDGSMWAPVDEGVERRDLDTLDTEILDAPAGSASYTHLYLGASGAWAVDITDPASRTVTITRIDTDAGSIAGTYRYQTYAAVGDRSGTAHPILPQLEVDAIGARTWWPAAPYEGTGPQPPWAIFEIVIP